MLRLIRVSRYNFLFSLSMATVSLSSGAGFSTFPLHSTCRTSQKCRDLAARILLLLKVSSNCLWWSPYIIDGNDPPLPQQLQRLFVVVVVVHFVCIDEDKVKCFSLAIRQEIVWKKQDGTKRYVELICHIIVSKTHIFNSLITWNKFSLISLQFHQLVKKIWSYSSF